MQCPECGQYDVANDGGVIKPHPRPDTLQLCAGKTQHTEPPRKTPAKKTSRKTKR